MFNSLLHRVGSVQVYEEIKCFCDLKTSYSLVLILIYVKLSLNVLQKWFEIHECLSDNFFYSLQYVQQLMEGKRRYLDEFRDKCWQINTIYFRQYVVKCGILVEILMVVPAHVYIYVQCYLLPRVKLKSLLHWIPEIENIYVRTTVSALRDYIVSLHIVHSHAANINHLFWRGKFWKNKQNLPHSCSSVAMLPQIRCYFCVQVAVHHEILPRSPETRDEPVQKRKRSDEETEVITLVGWSKFSAAKSSKILCQNLKSRFILICGVFRCFDILIPVFFMLNVWMFGMWLRLALVNREVRPWNCSSAFITRHHQELVMSGLLRDEVAQ